MVSETKKNIDSIKPCESAKVQLVWNYSKKFDVANKWSCGVYVFMVKAAWIATVGFWIEFSL